MYQAKATWFVAKPPKKIVFSLFTLAAFTLGIFLTIRLMELWRNADTIFNFTQTQIFNAFLTGLYFDIAVTALILIFPMLLLWIPLPAKLSKLRWLWAGIVLCIIAIPSFSLCWIDIELARYTHKKMYFQDIAILKEVNLPLNVLLKQHGPILWGWLITTLVWSILVFNILKSYLTEESPLISGRNYLNHFILLLIIIFLLITAIRGGWHRRPLNIFHADSEPHLRVWSLNSVFLMLKTFDEKKIKEKKWFDQTTEWKKHLNYFSPENKHKFAIRSEFENKRLQISHMPQNVVFIIMESLSADFLGKNNPAGNIVPFINELAEQSLFFPAAIANAHISIEGIPAALGGIPALGPIAFLNSRYTAIHFNGLGKQLNQTGYQTAFFHGAKRRSFEFDFFSKLAGFQKHFAKEDYPHLGNDDGVWGIYDGPFLQYVISKIDELHLSNHLSQNIQSNNKLLFKEKENYFESEKISVEKKPFAAAVFSLTAHHPFKLPNNYKSGLPTNADPMLHSQNYADSALKNFFKVAQTKPWYNDTLFVITGDHTNSPRLETYKNDPLRPWLVPILFFHPRMHWPKIDTNSIAQQIDIIPSITDFLGIKTEKHNLLSRSVFIPGPRIGFVRESTGFYFIDHAQALFFPHDETLQPRLVQRKIEPDQRKNELNEFTAEELLLRGKAAVQYFNEGMVNNRLVE